jgi:AraC-like DNA-binding protein
MQPKFNIDREHHNKLFYKEYENDKCIFQFHSHIELYFVEEGEMEFLVGGHQRTLRAGEMSVAISYESHAYKTREYSRSSVFIIPVYLCEQFIIATRNRKANSPFITDKETVSYIKFCINELKKENINEITQLGYIHVILGIVMDKIFSDENVPSHDALIPSKMLLYINENFKSEITLDSLAAKFGYHKSYVSRYFKQCFRVGFCEYLSAIRLKNAMILMNEQKHSITHCAMESGFNSMRTFYRVFHDEFGCSPRDYLDSLAANNRLEKIEIE